jgi:hypothetical protein
MYAYGLAYSEPVFQGNPEKLFEEGSSEFVNLVQMGLELLYPNLDDISNIEDLLNWEYFGKIRDMIKEFNDSTNSRASSWNTSDSKSASDGSDDSD